MDQNVYKDSATMRKLLESRLQKLGPVIYGYNNYEKLSVFEAQHLGENDYILGIQGGISYGRNYYRFHRKEYERLYPNIFQKEDRLLPALSAFSDSTDIVLANESLNFTTMDFSNAQFMPVNRIDRSIVFKPDNQSIRDLIDVTFETFVITEILKGVHGNVKHLSKMTLTSLFTIMLHAISVDSQHHHNGWRIEDTHRTDERVHNFEFRVGDLTDYELDKLEMKTKQERTWLSQYEEHSLVVFQGQEMNLDTNSKDVVRIKGIRPGNALNLYHKPSDKMIMFAMMYIVSNMINAQSENYPMIIDKTKKQGKEVRA